MRRVFLLIFCISFLASCGLSSSNPNSSGLDPTTSGSNSNFNKDMSIIQKANNQFAFHMLEELVKLNDKPNIFFSPASIHLALSNTYIGADGITKDEMAKVLQMEGSTLEETNKAYSLFLNRVKSKKTKATLNIANSIWLKENYPFLKEFKNTAKDYYHSTIHEVDFSNPKTKDNINHWVNEKTKGKIDKIIEEPIDASTVAYIINAIYFNGKWAQPFDKNAIFNGGFLLSNGQTKNHPFMSQMGEFNYFENELFQAIELPYENNEYSMFVFLPKADKSLSDFYQKLSYENWEKWRESLSTNAGTIYLPKFSFDYEMKLNEPLINLGMKEAFSGMADFSNMVENGGIYINEVRHKSYIDVNEKGTEAAAVTSVEVRETSLSIDTFTMDVNRPFFFLIQDNQSGFILFMGEVQEPMEKTS